MQSSPYSGGGVTLFSNSYSSWQSAPGTYFVDMYVQLSAQGHYHEFMLPRHYLVKKGLEALINENVIPDAIINLNLRRPRLLVRMESFLGPIEPSYIGCSAM